MRAYVVLLVFVALFACQWQVDARKLRDVIVDYIIVGGGTGGGVLASKLSASSHKVLVLEQGYEACGACTASPSAALGTVSSNNADPGFQGYYPKGQLGAGYIRAPLHIAFNGLGGSSRIYTAIANRPSREFIDNAYPAGYKYDDLVQQWQAVEDHYCHYIPSNITGISDADCATYHGKNGPVSVSSTVLQSATVGISDHLEDLVGRVKNDPSFAATFGSFNPDMNGPVKFGFSYVQSFHRLANKYDYLSARTKVGSYEAYLNSARSRSNLNIQLGARVLKVFICPSTKRAYGVKYMQDGVVKYAFASKHIFLAAGVIRTPQLLQLSGVGDPAVLSQYNITTIAENYQVGKNVRTHPSVVMGFKSTASAGARGSWPAGDASPIQWNVKLPVKYSDNNYYNATFQIQLGQGGKYIETLDLPAVGLPVDNSLFSTVSPANSQMQVVIVLNHADKVSKGSVTLQSSNPFVEPIFDLGWGYNFFDPYALETAMNKVRSLYLDSAWGQQWNITELSPGTRVSSIFTAPSAATTADRVFIQKNIHHSWHVTSSVGLGLATDLEGRVLNVTNLSVCDQSILPDITDSNPTATLYAICNKIADATLARVDLNTFWLQELIEDFEDDS